MKALVLCAGFGTRLGALTRDTPKALLPIGGEPLLAHTLRYLSAQGFTDVALNLHYFASKIREFVGDGSAFGVRAHLVEESEPLGTSGAVANLREYFQHEEEFLAMYGDLLIDQDLRPMLELHRSAKAQATLLLHERNVSNSFIRVDQNWQICELVERPADPSIFRAPFFVNSGLYILDSSVLQDIPSGFSDFPKDIFPAMLKQGKKLCGFPLSGYRCAIDSESRFREANEAFTNGAYHKVSAARR